MRKLALCLAFASLVGCASSTGAGSTSRGNPNVITADEIASTDLRSATLYDAITRLRPTFFKRRGTSSVNNEANYELRVRVDDVMLGGPDALKEIPAAEVAEVRYLSPGEAVTRFGAQYAGGAVVVTRKKIE